MQNKKVSGWPMKQCKFESYKVCNFVLFCFGFLFFVCLLFWLFFFNILLICFLFCCCLFFVLLCYILFVCLLSKIFRIFLDFVLWIKLKLKSRVKQTVRMLSNPCKWRLFLFLLAFSEAITLKKQITDFAHCAD